MSDFRTPPIDFAAGLDDARRYVRACFPTIGHDTLDDACQDGWLAYLKHAERIPAEYVQGYVNVCARHAAIALFHKAGRTLSLDALPEDALDVLAAPNADAQEHAERCELLALVDGLRPLRRRAMTAAALGLSHAETAEACGWSLRQVERHVREGRSELQALRA